MSATFTSITISIIIPTYNREKLLGRCLKHIAQNLAKNCEVVVVDDGSTDNTKSLIQHEFPDVKYIFQKNLGVSSARNTGIDVARGDLIALLDSDDLWDPSRLKILEQVSDQLPNDVGLIFNDMDVIIGDRGKGISWSDEYFGTPRDPVIQSMIDFSEIEVDDKKICVCYGNIYKKLIRGNIIQPSCTLVRKEVFENMGGFREDFRVANDSEFFLKVARHYKIAYVPLLLTSLEAPSQLSLSHPKNSFEKIKNMILAIREHMGLNNDPSVDRLLNRRLAALYALLGYHHLSDLCRAQARERYLQAIRIDYWNLKYYWMLPSTFLPKAVLRIFRVVKRNFLKVRHNA